jgi:hypothetical protein
MCVHYQGQGRCTAFPTRIPLLIFAGDVDHMIVRPGQTGDDVFVLMDFQAWQETGERRPAVTQPPPVASAVGRAAVAGPRARVRRQA